MVSWKKYLIKVLLHKLFHLLFQKILTNKASVFCIRSFDCMSCHFRKTIVLHKLFQHGNEHILLI